MKFFKELKYILMGIYHNFLSEHIGLGVYNNATTKHLITGTETLKLSSVTEQNKIKIENQVKNIIKKYIDSPEKLIRFISMHGANVYRIANAEKFLKSIGEEEGFLTPLKGLKALYIQIFLIFSTKEKINLKLTSPAMFIFDNKNVEIYTIARALYRYYGYKNHLPGYDYKSQETFKKLYSKKGADYEISGYSIKDILSCKEALARDLESINFTISLSIEHERAKKALKKLKEANSAKI